MGNLEAKLTGSYLLFVAAAVVLFAPCFAITMSLIPSYVACGTIFFDTKSVFGVIRPSVDDLLRICITDPRQRRPTFGCGVQVDLAGAGALAVVELVADVLVAVLLPLACDAPLLFGVLCATITPDINASARITSGLMC